MYGNVFVYVLIAKEQSINWVFWCWHERFVSNWAWIKGLRSRANTIWRWLILHRFCFCTVVKFIFKEKPALLWTLTIKKFSKVCGCTIKHPCGKVAVSSSSSFSSGLSLLTPDAAAPPQSGCVDTPALNCWQNTASPFTVMKSHFQPLRTPPAQPVTSYRRWHHPRGLGQAAKSPSGGALNAGVVAKVPPREKKKNDIQKGPCCPVEWAALINKVSPLALRA